MVALLGEDRFLEGMDLEFLVDDFEMMVNGMIGKVKLARDFLDG